MTTGQHIATGHAGIDAILLYLFIVLISTPIVLMLDFHPELMMDIVGAIAGYKAGWYWASNTKYNI